MIECLGLAREGFGFARRGGILMFGGGIDRLWDRRWVWRAGSAVDSSESNEGGSIITQVHTNQDDTNQDV